MKLQKTGIVFSSGHDFKNRCKLTTLAVLLATAGNLPGIILNDGKSFQHIKSQTL